jgi:hypothetical protein
MQELASLSVVLHFLVREKREDGKMKLEKIVTIVADVFGGLIVVLVGLAMLPFPLNLVWGTFNAWLWIGAPTAILWAKKKEDEKKTS